MRISDWSSDVCSSDLGSMRVLLATPLPRGFLLLARMLSGTVVSIIQVYAFIAIAALCGTEMPPSGLLPLLPVLVLTGVTLSALGMFLSSRIRQLENFAGVMNFLIFRSEEHTSELQSLMRISYAVFCLKKKK